jgi:hypothetical protein
MRYLENAPNRLTNAALAPVTKMPEYKVCAVRLEKPAYRAFILAQPWSVSTMTGSPCAIPESMSHPPREKTI